MLTTAYAFVFLFIIAKHLEIDLFRYIFVGTSTSFAYAKFKTPKSKILSDLVSTYYRTRIQTACFAGLLTEIQCRSKRRNRNKRKNKETNVSAQQTKSSYGTSRNKSEELITNQVQEAQVGGESYMQCNPQEAITT